MKTSSSTLIFVSGFILLTACPCWSQQQRQVALMTRNEPPALERKKGSSSSAERQASARIPLQKRINALRRYLATIDPASRDYRVTENSIREMELQLRSPKEGIHGNLYESSVKRDGGAVSNSRVKAEAVGGGTAVNEAVPQQSTQQEVRQECPTTATTNEGESEAFPLIDHYNAVIKTPKDARAIIDATLGSKIKAAKMDIDSDNFYCVIHVVSWKKPSKSPEDKEGEEGQKVQAQNWYVYHNNGKNPVEWSQVNFHTAKRIYGVNRIWLLYIHLNKLELADYEARYQLTITKKTPANIANLLSAAELFVGAKALTNSKTQRNATPQFESVYGGWEIPVDFNPSDIAIMPTIVKVENDVDCSDAGKILAEKPQALIEDQQPTTFDNEGRYWWDISVGVPVRRIRELEFDSTANTVTAKEVDRQNIFALLNLYPRPVDIKSTNYSLVPHFVGGVAIAKQPLHKILVGLGVGPHFANFYIGALFVKQPRLETLNEGDPATPEQVNANTRRKYKAQVAFGLNLPVRGIVESLKKAGK